MEEARDQRAFEGRWLGKTKAICFQFLCCEREFIEDWPDQEKQETLNSKDTEITAWEVPSHRGAQEGDMKT